MKKFITAAALLAAGTMFANAASLVLSTDVGETTGTAKGITGFTFSLSSDWLTGALSSTDYSSFTLSSLSIEVASNYVSTNVYYLAIRDLSTNLFVDVSNAGTLSGTTATFSFEDTPSLGIDMSYAVYFLTASGNSAPTETAEGGLTKGSWAAANVVSYANTDIGTSDTSHGFITAGSGSTILSDAAAKPNITISGTAIPEPSAFGLLAGLGALALVASRRRRRAK